MAKENAVLESLGIFPADQVLGDADRPVVHIVVEGKVGSGKTAILALIQKALEGKVPVRVQDEYTERELKVHEGANSEEELLMYSPVVVICEKLNPAIPNIVRT